jgi:hypothetical protein
MSDDPNQTGDLEQQLARLRAFLDAYDDPQDAPLVPLRTLSRMLMHNVEIHHAARRYMSEVAIAASEITDSVAERHKAGDQTVDLPAISHAMKRIARATLEFDEELQKHAVDF